MHSFLIIYSTFGIHFFIINKQNLLFFRSELKHCIDKNLDKNSLPPTLTDHFYHSS